MQHANIFVPTLERFCAVSFSGSNKSRLSAICADLKTSVTFLLSLKCSMRLIALGKQEQVSDYTYPFSKQDKTGYIIIRSHRTTSQTEHLAYQCSTIRPALFREPLVSRIVAILFNTQKELQATGRNLQHWNYTWHRQNLAIFVQHDQRWLRDQKTATAATVTMDSSRSNATCRSMPQVDAHAKHAPRSRLHWPHSESKALLFHQTFDTHSVKWWEIRHGPLNEELVHLPGCNQFLKDTLPVSKQWSAPN